MSPPARDPTPRQLIERLIEEVVNAGRLEAIDELFSSDMAPIARQWFGAFRSSFPDLQMIYFFTVAGGRIVHGWGIEDTLSRLEQLGLLGR